MDLYCIHLPHRTDRRAHIDALRTRYPSFRIHLVDGVADSNPVTGCFLSHRKCIEMAKVAGWPYIIVLEDDCDFLVSDAELLDRFKTMIAYPNADVVNGCGNLGHFSVNSCAPFRNMWFLRSTEMYTTHCVMYKAGSYDTILSSSPCPQDVLLMTRTNMVYTYPYLATQIASYSDLAKTNVDYTNIQLSRSFVANHIHSLRK